MSLLPGLRNFKHCTSWTRLRRAAVCPRQRASFCMELEALEDRQLFSTLTVTIAGSSSLYAGQRSAPGFGGGILNHGTLTISACTVSGTVMGFGQGGGIFNDGTLNVIGCTVSNSFAEGSAGSEEAGTAAAACG